MDNVSYYGLYSTMIGAVSVSIMSVAQDSNRFPPGIFYNESSYRFIRYYRASTPSQIVNLLNWAEDSNIEINVTLNY